MMQPLILQACEEQLGSKVKAIVPVSGGDISDAYQLSTAEGSFFLKVHQGEEAGVMFRAEAKGLERLGSAGGIKVPQVMAHGEQFLLMEFINSSVSTATFWERFGHQLAQVHRQTQSQFGLDHSNFIGSLPQINPRPSHVANFPQVRVHVHTRDTTRRRALSGSAARV